MNTKRRDLRSHAWLLPALFASFLFSCSSGLEGSDSKGTVDSARKARTNLGVAFDPCLRLSAPMSQVDAAGGVLPTLTGSGERPVAFFAFVTAADADDGDGLGMPLDPDAPADPNGDLDVFIAAIDSTAIDQRAFTYSIAGTMRHPRCVTCHQMNVDVVADPSALPPTPFLTQPHFPEGGGKPPLNDLSAATCAGCHFEDWKAPGPSFDLRRNSTADLFARAQVAPGGLNQHFRTDTRVLWALGNGQTPFGGAADDDHDGIDEPEDTDGVRRHTPGGAQGFIKRLDAWLETADPITGVPKFSSAAESVHDIVLASRDGAGVMAGDGRSFAPSLTYVPNPAFVVGVSDPTVIEYGTIFVAFASDATDMVAGGSVFTDIFRATIGVFEDAEGKIDLRYDTLGQLHVSTASGGGDATGDAGTPDISADGQRIAYGSTAVDAIASFSGACRPEVYVYDDALGQNFLVSRSRASATSPGNAGAINPALSPDGMAVAFESDATDYLPLGGDTNAARDVFYVMLDGLPAVGAPLRASAQSNGSEFAGHAHAPSIVHDAGNVKVAFAVRDVPLAPVASVTCPAVVVNLGADRDTYLDQKNSGSSFGNGTAIHVGRTGTDGNPAHERRGLIHFDIAGSIPAGSLINSVTLSMFLNQEAGSAGAGACPSPVPNTIELRPATVNWTESSTWNTMNANFGGISASTTVNGIGTKTWPTGGASDAFLVADVQNWLDNPGSNFGWMLKGTNVNCTAKQLRSSEGAPVPQLQIDYTPGGGFPEPSAGIVIADSDVFLRDTATNRTVQVNRIVGPDGTFEAEEFDIDGSPLFANAMNPVLSPYGNAIVFETSASNLDVVRPFDDNRTTDVVLVDLQQLDAQGFALPYVLSVTSDGGYGNDRSHSPMIAPFAPRTDAFPLGLAVFATRATNLGDSDPGDLDGDGIPENDNFIVSFLREGATVIADFEADPVEQGASRAVRFLNVSSGDPTSFEWDFGDGTPTSSAKSPTHSYATPGTYTVSLTVSGGLGTDSRTRTQYVTVRGPVVASFTSTKDATSAPDQPAAMDVPFGTNLVGVIDAADPDSELLLDLDSSASLENPTAFTWTLRPVNAGGAPIGPAQVVSNLANPTDVPIDSSGFFDLSLRAEGAGGIDTATQRLEIYRKVTAAFTADVEQGDADLTVNFTDTSTGDVAAAGAWLWDFGDGMTSTLQNPSHTFLGGVWPVTLTVTGRGGDVELSQVLNVVSFGDITSLFRIEPQPAGSVDGLLAGEAIGNEGVLVDFTNLSQEAGASALSYFWDFGNGTTSTLAEPTASFDTLNADEVQQFTIRLVASTNGVAPNDCTGQPAGTCDERTGVFTMYPQIDVEFNFTASFTDDPLFPEHMVDFGSGVVGDGLGTDPELRWLRSEPGGTVPSIVFATDVSDVVNTFEDAGDYAITLEVETNAPGGGRQTVQATPLTINVTATTFSDFYVQSVDPMSGARCTNCHAGPNPAAQLDWSAGGSFDPSAVWDLIVEDGAADPVFSRRCNTNRRLIEPFDAVNSVVYNVLRNPVGPLCSINMRINLPGDENRKNGSVAKLRSWISGGALND